MTTHTIRLFITSLLCFISSSLGLPSGAQSSAPPPIPLTHTPSHPSECDEGGDDILYSLEADAYFRCEGNTWIPEDPPQS